MQRLEIDLRDDGQSPGIDGAVDCTRRELARARRTDRAGLPHPPVGRGALRSRPPSPPHPPPERAHGPAREVRGERPYVGPGWLSRERGLWELPLEGDPYARGFADARLGSRLIGEVDDYLFGEMARYVPSPVARSLIRFG